MSAISVIREYRNLGDSWPKAIVSAVEFKGRLGWALRDAGWAILHTGDKVLNEGPPTSTARAFCEGVEFERRCAERRAPGFAAGVAAGRASVTA